MLKINFDYLASVTNRLNQQSTHMNRLGNALALGTVAAPHARSKAVLDTVGALDHILLHFKGHHADDGAENLLLHAAAAVLEVDDDCRAHEVAVLVLLGQLKWVNALATEHLAALLDGNVHVAADLIGVDKESVCERER
jgi:hypothetical protein